MMRGNKYHFQKIIPCLAALGISLACSSITNSTSLVNPPVSGARGTPPEALMQSLHGTASNPLAATGWVGQPLTIPDVNGTDEKIAMAVGPHGAIHMVWALNGSKNVIHLFYEKKGPEESDSWSQPVEILSDSTPQGNFGPIDLAIAVDSRESPHIVWTQGATIVDLHQDGSGTWLPPETIGPAVCTGNDCWRHPPILLVDKEDAFHLFWVDGQDLLISSRTSEFHRDKPAGSHSARAGADFAGWGNNPSPRRYHA